MPYTAIMKSAESPLRFKRTGVGYAGVTVRVEPRDDLAVVVESTLEEGAISQAYLDACLAGIREATEQDFHPFPPVRGVTVSLIQADAHTEHSTVDAFHQAGGMSFNYAISRADPVLVDDDEIS